MTFMRTKIRRRLRRLTGGFVLRIAAGLCHLRMYGNTDPIVGGEVLRRLVVVFAFSALLSELGPLGLNR